MSVENATKFLEEVAQRNDIRSHFLHVRSPQEFANVAGDLGFHFTPQELKDVVKEHSAGVNQRRHTGVWEWLRTVPWVEKTGGDLKAEVAESAASLSATAAVVPPQDAAMTADLATTDSPDASPDTPDAHLPEPVLENAPESSR